jgi:Secretion system C-terminal sorting domain
MKQFFSLLLVCGLMFSIPAYAQGPGGTSQGGVTISTSTLADKEVPVGVETCFGLTARDDNGNVIRSWDNIGSPITITLFNSEANTDTSLQSWSSNPDEYSYATFTHDGTELVQISDNEWSLPPSAFVMGVTEICLIHTRADTGVYFEITPLFPPLNQTSETITFTAGETSNILVDLTSSIQGADQVFMYRKYEVVVAPRDKYLNINNEQIRARFSARWPGEFVNSLPDFSDIFSGDVFIQGVTNYFLASTISRELPQATGQLQMIRAFKNDDPSITGQTDDYEILDHAPYDFALLTPVDRTKWNVDVDLEAREFTWEQPNPADPYTMIPISLFNNDIGNDDVTYTWVCVDSSSLTQQQRIDSDNTGTLPKLSLNNIQLRGVANAIAGHDGWAYQPVYWFVEATDGLYIKKSTPPTNDPRPGFYLLLEHLTGLEQLPVAPTSMSLSQNYPNPFNPNTNIRFETVKQAKVTLKVYDLIGNEVETLVDDNLAPGVYNADFDAHKLPTGVYIYRLATDGKTMTKRMVLSK